SVCFQVYFAACARRGKQSVYLSVYLVAVRSPRQAKRVFSRLSCRGASAATSQACILAFILSRCTRRDQPAVHFRVYLVAVRSPWQARRKFSRLSCRGVLAAAIQACSFQFVLSQCARHDHSQVISPFYLLTCTHSEASFSK